MGQFVVLLTVAHIMSFIESAFNFTTISYTIVQTLV